MAANGSRQDATPEVFVDWPPLHCPSRELLLPVGQLELETSLAQLIDVVTGVVVEKTAFSATNGRQGESWRVEDEPQGHEEHQESEDHTYCQVTSQCKLRIRGSDVVNATLGTNHRSVDIRKEVGSNRVVSHVGWWWVAYPFVCSSFVTACLVQALERFHLSRKHFGYRKGQLSLDWFLESKRNTLLACFTGSWRSVAAATTVKRATAAKTLLNRSMTRGTDRVAWEAALWLTGGQGRQTATGITVDCFSNLTPSNWLLTELRALSQPSTYTLRVMGGISEFREVFISKFRIYFCHPNSQTGQPILLIKNQGTGKDWHFQCGHEYTFKTGRCHSSRALN